MEMKDKSGGSRKQFFYKWIGHKTSTISDYDSSSGAK